MPVRDAVVQSDDDCPLGRGVAGDHGCVPQRPIAIHRTFHDLANDGIEALSRLQLDAVNVVLKIRLNIDPFGLTHLRAAGDHLLAEPWHVLDPLAEVAANFCQRRCLPFDHHRATYRDRWS